MVHIFLADGFEEIEAISTIDILRRCEIEVFSVSVNGKRTVTGAHGIVVKADRVFRLSESLETECLILPGGMPGAENLASHDGLAKALLNQAKRTRPIAAICAAPLVLGRLGILEGKRATCYPGFESELKGATLTGEPVSQDGNVITAFGPAAASDFAFTIARHLKGADAEVSVKNGMLFS